MKKITGVVTILMLANPGFSQYTPDSISETEVKRIIEILASDSLKGRGNYTVGGSYFLCSIGSKCL
ncbi:MAG TPA: hypothetical protein VNA26_09355 [Chitinophagaceae bacterium]|nr:hypothetical protein [Chitinophagaceae bacterium]